MKSPRDSWKRLLIEGWAYLAIAAIAFAAGLAIGLLGRDTTTEVVNVTAPSNQEAEAAGAEAEAGGTEGQAGGTEGGSQEALPESESESESASAELFASAGCGSCHTLAAAGTTGEVGPNLDEFLAPDDTTEAVEEMIVDPNAELAEGYAANVMPRNYGQTMSAAEVHQLAEYLVATTPANP